MFLKKKRKVMKKRNPTSFPAAKRRRLSPWFIAFVALAAPGVFANAQSLPLAPGAQVTDLSSSGYFDEPAIAVNPNNPRQLVAAYQVPAHVAYSVDAGLHWQLASGTASPHYRVSGDVSVAYDTRGHAILCYIAFDQLGTTNYWAHNATRNGIFIRRSLDGGKTWAPEEIQVIAQPTRPGIPFEDKPYIVADNTRGPYAGNLYVGWTEFTLTQSVISFSRSDDGGQSWSKPIRISTHAGLPRDDTGSVEGFTGAIAADGTLYVTWADGSNVAFTYSLDGGRSFAPSRNILDTAPSYFQLADVARANGFPEIAVDPKTGRLFVVWSDYRNGEIDVYSSTSEDQGRTWAAAIPVNSDPAHDGADHFFQWLAVDPTNGAVNVIFYDRRDDPRDRKTIAVLARSTDAGKSFTNYAWTADGFDPDEDFIGDYNGIAAFGGRVYGIWTEEVAASKKPGKPDAGEGKQPVSNPAANVKFHRTFVRVGIADFNSAK
jgi:hypothetical protein